MGYYKIKNLNEDPKVFRQTDKGFETNTPLLITIRVDLNKVESPRKGVYKVKIYRPDLDSLQELEINCEEANWYLVNFEELFKNDLSQFSRIYLQSVEHHDD